MTIYFWFDHFLEARAEIEKKIVRFLEELKTKKNSSEIYWPLKEVENLATGGIKATNAGISAGTAIANVAATGANMGADHLNKKAIAQNNQGNVQALSGGNTVQIPTIFFMVLAIFNR